MKVGVIGFSGSGKSTFYRAAAVGKAKGDLTAVPVPDDRFTQIVQQVKPKKVTPATVIFDDGFQSLQGTGKMFSQKTIDEAKKSDLLLHIVRSFENPIYPYHEEIDPIRDHKRVEEEILIMDLQLVENRLERLKKSLQTKVAGSIEYTEKGVFDRLLDVLSEGTALRDTELSEEELVVMKNYQFLSLKPIITAFNVDESQLSDPSNRLSEYLKNLGEKKVPAFVVCGPIEEEIAQLDPEDQPEFLASLGLDKPASARVIRVIYDTLGLITFFTAGESETRAWSLKRGSNALKAAGTIHNDIAKGFIRAEVVHYNDYLESGNLDAAYSAGKMKLEGKEYVMQDGDLLHIRNKS